MGQHIFVVDCYTMPIVQHKINCIFLFVMMFLTDPYYFIPAFVELTSTNLEENRRLIREHGITFPIGMVVELHCVDVLLSLNVYSQQHLPH